MSDQSFADSIILLGPYGVGKTTTAQELHELLGWPMVESDEKLWDYLRAEGFQLSEFFDLDDPASQPWHVKVAQRFLAAHATQPHILEFRGGMDTYDSPYFEEMQVLLQPYPNVVSLLPCDDTEEAIAYLTERITQLIVTRKMRPTAHARFNRYLISHSSSRKLAKVHIYTKSKGQKTVAHEICKRLNLL